MAEPIYDVIVLGCGGVGSAVASHLAQRGSRVLGIDRFEPPHEYGSSHGQTRIIRQAYFEHSCYVPLLLRSYELWNRLEAAVGAQLYFRTGLLQAGPGQGIVVPGVCHAAAEHGLQVERLSADEATRRFPGFYVPPHLQAVFEHNAGYLLVEECVRAHLENARKHGAAFVFGHDVVSWKATARDVSVETTHGRFTAARLVIAAGARATSLLSDLGVRLRVLRKHVYWLATDDHRPTASETNPAFLFELPEGVFYGFPVIDARGLKLGEHSGGEEVFDPLADTRQPDPADLARTLQFARAYLPGVRETVLDRSVCFYTMSPDENFIVDVHPEYSNVAFAAGLSGHGFKFTSVLGEILADLSLAGKTEFPIDFLRLNRASLGSHG